jgi:hypothetical protein
MCHARFALAAEIRGAGTQRGSRSLKGSKTLPGGTKPEIHIFLHTLEALIIFLDGGDAHAKASRRSQVRMPRLADSDGRNTVEFTGEEPFQINLEGFRRWNACRRMRPGARLICDGAPSADGVLGNPFRDLFPHPPIRHLCNERLEAGPDLSLVVEAVVDEPDAFPVARRETAPPFNLGSRHHALLPWTPGPMAARFAGGRVIHEPLPRAQKGLLGDTARPARTVPAQQDHAAAVKTDPAASGTA